MAEHVTTSFSEPRKDSFEIHARFYFIQVPVCPDCRAVDCYPELSQEDCPEGAILKEGLAFGGCCPACVTYMGEGEIIHIQSCVKISPSKCSTI